MSAFIPDKDFTLSTERFVLRRPADSDLSQIFEATKTPGFNDGMVWDPPAALDEMYEFHELSLKHWDSGQSYGFSIDSKEDGEFLGRIGIRPPGDRLYRCWNVGFYTLPKAQGRGVMSEALEVILEFGFSTLGAQEIEATCADWNMASRRVLEKNGMEFIRRVPEGFQKNGEWVVEDVFSKKV